MTGPVQPSAAQHAAHERRLARAEVARQRDHHAARRARARARARRARSRRRRAGRRCRAWHRRSGPSPLRYARAMDAPSHDANVAPPRLDRARRAHRALGRASWASSAVGIAGHRSRRREEARLAATGSPPAGTATMDYMARHGARPRAPGGARARHAARDHRAHELLARRRRATRATCSTIRERAYVSRYALGRDYHKVLRARLQQLADRIARRGRRRSATACSPTARRCWRSRSPRRPGLGWRGKHTLLLTRDAGSWFFLGEIYTDLPLPRDAAGQRRTAARCTRVHRRVPDRRDRRAVRARRAPLHLLPDDRAARAAIPEELRPLIGNRIYGCDDCQLACPWNRYAQVAARAGFRRAPRPRRRRRWSSCSRGPRPSSTRAWPAARSAASATSAGCATSRSALGNAPSTPAVVAALAARADDPSPLVREHVAWALARHERRPRRRRIAPGERAGRSARGDRGCARARR